MVFGLSFHLSLCLFLNYCTWLDFWNNLINSNLTSLSVILPDCSGQTGGVRGEEGLEERENEGGRWDRETTRNLYGSKEETDLVGRGFIGVPREGVKETKWVRI